MGRPTFTQARSFKALQRFNPGHKLARPAPAIALAMQRKPAIDAERTQSLDAGVLRTLGLQAKLAVGAVGEPFEQEADAIAAQVVEQVNTPASTAPGVQRKGVEKHKPQNLLQVQRVNIAQGSASLMQQDSLLQKDPAPTLSPPFEPGYATEAAQLHNVDDQGTDQGTVPGGSKIKSSDAIEVNQQDVKGNGGIWIKARFNGKEGYLRRTKVFIFSDVNSIIGKSTNPSMSLEDMNHGFASTVEKLGSTTGGASDALGGDAAKALKLGTGSASSGLNVSAGLSDTFIGLIGMVDSASQISQKNAAWDNLQAIGSFTESTVKSASGVNKQLDSLAKAFGEGGVGSSSVAANFLSAIADGLGAVKSAALGIIGIYKLYKQSADRPKQAAELFKNLFEAAANASKVAKSVSDILQQTLAGLAYAIPGLSIAVSTINLIIRLFDALASKTTSKTMGQTSDGLRLQVAASLGVEIPTQENPGVGFELDRRGTFPAYKTYFRLKGAIRQAVQQCHEISEESSGRLEKGSQTGTPENQQLKFLEEKDIVKRVIDASALPDAIKTKFKKSINDAKSLQEYKEAVKFWGNVNELIQKYEFIDKMAEINQKRGTSGWTDVAMELVNISGDIVTIATSPSGVGAIVGQALKASTAGYKAGHGAAKFVQGIHRTRTGSHKSASNKHKEYCQHARFIYSQIAKLSPTDLTQIKIVEGYIDAAGMGITEFTSLAKTPEKQVEELVKAMKKRS